MKSPIFSRRRFFSLLLLIPILARCKKDALKPVYSKAPIPPPTDDYLAQYGITEVGSGVWAPNGINNTFDGYTDKLSYKPGDKAALYLSGQPKNEVTMDLKDINGNAKMSLKAPLTTQNINSLKPWADGFLFDKTASVQLPADLKSGIYTWDDYIPMIIKGNSASYDLTVVYPTNTLNAYNGAGGKNLYGPSYGDRATVLSFLRSVYITNVSFFKFLAGLNYNINYIADSDLDDYSQINNSKAVIITGHSEYWTRQARQNIDAFVKSGRNLLVLSGNTMWWQVRYNKNKDRMICYKSTSGSCSDNSNSDPLSNTIYNTVNWGSSSIGYPTTGSLGVDYRYGGYGNTLPNRWNGFKILNENSPLFQGTGLKNNDILSVPTREYDGAPMVRYYPPGSNNVPQIDETKLNYSRIEFLGFDYAQNLITKNQLGYGTFIVCQKTPGSGTVVNTSSNDWCSNTTFNGADKSKVETITKNMIDLSLAGASLFS